METLQFYITSAIGVLLIVIAALVLLTVVAFLLRLVLDSDNCERVGYIFLTLLGYVVTIASMLALVLLGISMFDSAELFFGH